MYSVSSALPRMTVVLAVSGLATPAPLSGLSFMLAPAPDTVLVAPPTGSVEIDPVQVQEAFDRVQPGDTIYFAPGTYLMGQGARLTVPEVTVLGHPDGTVLRGCEPEHFELREGLGMEDQTDIVFGCTGLFVLADRQTIRGLTFDHAWHGLVVGHLQGPPGTGPANVSFGGHRIEGNTFRHVPNGIRVIGPTDAVTVIRDNEVVNAYHAFNINSAPVHLIDNRISVPDPHSVPTSSHPESGVILSATGPPNASCEGSLVAGNIIDGTVHGIQVLGGPGEVCADHEIRDNIIRIRPVPLPAGFPDHLRDFYFGEGAEGTTVAGIAIRLYGITLDGDSAAGPLVRDVQVTNNRIVGGSGLGIQLVATTGAQIVGNTISYIRRRSPLPGLTWGDDPERWRSANGAGVWISEDSGDNLVADNFFHEIDGPFVQIAGAENEIHFRETDPPVVDRGRDNRIRTNQPPHDTAPSVLASALARSDPHVLGTRADSIVSLTYDLARAWTKLEPERYLGYLSNDLVFYFEGGRLGRAAFENVIRTALGSLRSSTFEVNDPEVVVLGPNAAVISFGLREQMVSVEHGEETTESALTPRHNKSAPRNPQRRFRFQ